MRKPMHLALLLVAAFLLTHNTAYGQNYGLYCTSGLHPDGYIDFSALPAAPPIPVNSPSAPVTATLPVIGVPGLTVTITIPALQFGDPAGPAVPAYSVNGGTLTLNGFPGSLGTAAPALVLNFNQPILGLGVNVQNPQGRFGYAYNLQEGDGTKFLPAFNITTGGYTNAFLSPRNVNLQVVGINATPPTTFQTAALAFPGYPLEFFETVTFANVRVQSTSAPDPASSIPTQGLQQWLRADKGTNYNSYSPLDPGTGIWQDQSGNGHDAMPSLGHQPTLSADSRTCQPTWQFNGASSFNFNLPIAGWTKMTVFLVANNAQDPPGDDYYSEAAAILWTENAFWGNTFVSPYQTHVYSRFGTTQVGNNLSYTRPASGIGQDFTVTRAVHNKDTDEIYVNGLRAFSQGGKLDALSGVSGAGTIGLGLNNKYFNGEISEILVYNRVLSDNEAARVESYLSKKYGIQ
jgi:hypothetical protein